MPPKTKTLPPIKSQASGKSELTKAAEAGKLKTVQKLIKKGADVNSYDGEDETVLMVAARKGDLQLVTWLIEKGGANPNLPHRGNGQSILSLTLSTHNLEKQKKEDLFKFFLQKGVIPKSAEIVTAFLNEHQELAILIAKNEKVDINAQNAEGDTVLLRLVLNSRNFEEEKIVACAKFLLSLGAKPSIQNKSGETPLQWAVKLEQPALAQLFLNSTQKLSIDDFITAIQSGNLNAVKHILDTNVATVNQLLTFKSPVGLEEISPLMLAVHFQQTEIVHYLIKHKADVNWKNKLGEAALPLSVYANPADPKIVDALIKAGADVNHRDINGNPLCISAAQESTPSIFIKLLSTAAKNPIDINVKGKRGETALSQAIYFKNKPLVQLLLSIPGVHIDTPNEHGFTPLMVAALVGDTDTIAWLVDHGANLSHKDKAGMNALMCVAGQGHLNTLKILLEKNPSAINDRNFNGFSALNIAVNTGDSEIVKLLLQKGAKSGVNDRYLFGLTVLLAATHKGYTAIVKLLLQNGAKPDMTDTIRGWSPLRHAIKKGHLEIVQLLLEYFDSYDLSQKDNVGLNVKEFAIFHRNPEIIAALEQYELKQTFSNFCSQKKIPEQLLLLLHEHQIILEIQGNYLRLQIPTVDEPVLLTQENLIGLYTQCEGTKHVGQIYNQFVKEHVYKQYKNSPDYREKQISYTKNLININNERISQKLQVLLNIKKEIFEKVELNQKDLGAAAFKTGDTLKKYSVDANITKMSDIDDHLKVIEQEISTLKEQADNLSTPTLDECELVLEESEKIAEKLSSSISYFDTTYKAQDEQQQFLQNSIQAWERNNQKQVNKHAKNIKGDQKKVSTTEVKETKPQAPFLEDSHDLTFNSIAEFKSQPLRTLSTPEVVLHVKKEKKSERLSLYTNRNNFFTPVSQSQPVTLRRPQTITLESSVKLTAALEAYESLDQVNTVLQCALETGSELQFNPVKNALLGCCARMMEKFKRVDNTLNPFTAEMARKFRNVCYHAQELFDQPESIRKIVAMTIEISRYASAVPKTSTLRTPLQIEPIQSELWDIIQEYNIQENISFQHCEKVLLQAAAELEYFNQLPNREDTVVKIAIEFTIAKLGAYAAKVQELYPDKYKGGICGKYGRYIPEGAAIRHADFSPSSTSSSSSSSSSDYSVKPTFTW